MSNYQYLYLAHSYLLSIYIPTISLSVISPQSLQTTLCKLCIFLPSVNLHSYHLSICFQPSVSSDYSSLYTRAGSAACSVELSSDCYTQSSVDTHHQGQSSRRLAYRQAESSAEVSEISSICMERTVERSLVGPLTSTMLDAQDETWSSHNTMVNSGQVSAIQVQRVHRGRIECVSSMMCERGSYHGNQRGESTDDYGNLQASSIHTEGATLHGRIECVSFMDIERDSYHSNQQAETTGHHGNPVKSVKTAPAVLGERPPCLGQEVSPFRQGTSYARLGYTQKTTAHCHMIERQLSGMSTDNTLVNTTVNSDASTFMEQPLCKEPVTKTRRKSLSHKLKKIGRHLHSRKSATDVHTLAVL